MANEQYDITFSVNESQTRQNLESIAQAAESTQKKLQGVADALESTFTSSDLSNYHKTSVRYGKDLADSFLVMRLQLGQLKTAFVDAAMPVAGVFIPVLNDALTSVVQTVRGVGSVLNALFGSEETTDALAQSFTDTADAGETLKSSVKSTGKAVKKALLDFDKIQRLSVSSSGGSTGSETAKSNDKQHEYKLSDESAAAVDTILRYIEPLQNIDFSAAVASFNGLTLAVQGLANTVGQALSWAWFNILVPMTAWVIEEGAPASLNLLKAAFELLQSVLQPVWTGLQTILTALQPVAEYIQDTVLLILSQWTERFSGLAALFQEKGPVITGIFQNIAQIIGAAWESIAPVLTALREGVSYAFDGVWQVVKTVVSNMLDILGRLTAFLSGLFTGDVKGTLENLKGLVGSFVEGIGQTLTQGLLAAIRGVLSALYTVGVTVGQIFGLTKDDVKGAVNGIIGFINGMISGLVSGINTVIQALNRLKIDIPQWVPKFGGRSFGFSLSPITAPSIPYLAQGAVIPPNRQFLAVLGDQKQGTNIEAPLDTIKQALAEVMAMQGGGNITVNFTGDLAQLGRVLKPVIDRENVRVGSSLARGVL